MFILLDPLCWKYTWPLRVGFGAEVHFVNMQRSLSYGYHIQPATKHMNSDQLFPTIINALNGRRHRRTFSNTLVHVKLKWRLNLFEAIDWHSSLRNGVLGSHIPTWSVLFVTAPCSYTTTWCVLVTIPSKSNRSLKFILIPRFRLTVFTILQSSNAWHITPFRFEISKLNLLRPGRCHHGSIVCVDLLFPNY